KARQFHLAAIRQTNLMKCQQIVLFAARAYFPLRISGRTYRVYGPAKELPFSRRFANFVQLQKFEQCLANHHRTLTPRLARSINGLLARDCACCCISFLAWLRSLPPIRFTSAPSRASNGSRLIPTRLTKTGFTW